MRRTALAMAFLIVTVSRVHAGSYGTELPFVSGTGARTSAMGLAGTSLIGYPSLQYYNPASIAGQQRGTFEFYRTTLFDSDSRYHTAAFVYPTLDYGAFGLSVLRFDVGGVEQRDEMNNLLGEIKNTQSRVLFGYGLNIHRSIAIGFNMKIDNQSFGDYSATGIGGDIGAIGTRDLSDIGIFRTLRAGLAIHNLIEPSIKLDAEDVVDPTEVAAGVSLESRYGRFGFVTATDITSPRQSPVDFRFGQEFTYLDQYAVRLGVDRSTLTFGIGASWRGISADYAYRSEDLGGNHRFSLTVAYGSTVDARSDARRQRADEMLQARVEQQVQRFESDQLARTKTAADSLFAAHDFARARERYEMVLLWDAENERATARIAECTTELVISEAERQISEGDYLSALRSLRSAIDRGNESHRIHDLADVCTRQIETAADRTTMIERLVRNSIDLYAEAQYADAYAGFHEVLRLSPDHELAAEYERKARTQIRNAVKRHIREAESLARREQYTAALSQLEGALALDPKNTEARTATTKYRNLLRAQLTRGQEKHEAAQQPRPAINGAALDEKYEAGVSLFEQGNFDEAVRLLLEVWTVAPNYRNVTQPLTKAYLFMGMKKYSQESYAEAIQIWEKILTIDPGNVKAQRYLQKTREEAQRLGAADNG